MKNATEMRIVYYMGKAGNLQIQLPEHKLLRDSYRGLAAFGGAAILAGEATFLVH